MKLYLNFLLGSLLLSHSMANSSAILSQLARPDGKMEEVKLPFEYRSLTPTEKKTAVWVPEMFYTVLGGDSKITSALVGPLFPCIVIAVRYEPLDKVIVMHLYIKRSKPEQVLEIMKKEFGSDIDPAGIRVLLFTKSTKYFPHLFSPETQKTFFMSVFTLLTETFSLGAHQMTARIFSAKHPDNYLFYHEADANVVVDKNLTASSFSFVAERIFNSAPVSLENIAREVKYVRDGLEAARLYYTINCRSANMQATSFLRITDAVMGLEKLAISH